MKDDKKFPQDYGTEAIIAYYDCGCTVAIHVLTGDEARAYKRAAEWAKEGRKVRVVDLGWWKEEQGIFCSPEHQTNPPWKEAKPMELGL